MEVDVNAAPSAAEVPEATQSGVTATVDAKSTTPAEAAKNTDAQVKTEEEPARIPYSRLAKEIENRKRIELRTQELEAELLKARTTVTPAAPQAEAEESEPPEHLTERQKVTWYVEQDAKNLFNRELGMSLAQVKALLSTVPETAQESNQNKWTRTCAQYGLDPDNREVQDMVRSFVKGGGHDIETAFELTKGYIGKTAPVTAATPQRMENGTSTGAMTSENVGIVFDAKQARELAQAGKRSPNVSFMDILDASAARKKAARAR